MKLDNIKNVYIIGIEGAGTSALAGLLQAQGKKVAGSDEGNHFYHDILAKAGIQVFHHYSPKNLQQAFPEEKIDLIIYSTALKPENNRELQTALNQDIPVLSYPEALGMFFNQAKNGIAVCGTHGKTTTTAMLVTILQKAGYQPTAIVGAKMLAWQTNALFKGKPVNAPNDLKNKHSHTVEIINQENVKNAKKINGKAKTTSVDNDIFLIEADEYQNKLQYYKPKAAILTTVDYDHPDYFSNETAYQQVFRDFVKKLPSNGVLVTYAGDPNVLAIAREASCPVVFYDQVGAEKILSKKCPANDCRGQKLGCCSGKNLPLFAGHNLLNAMAAFQMARWLGVKPEIIRLALADFQGTAQRFEHQGEFQGALIIDDYAHHPTEIKSVLELTRNTYPGKRIKCLFQPHTFSRTEAFLDKFIESLALADEVYLLDIFASAREKQGKINSDDLIAGIVKKFPNRKAKNLRTVNQAEKFFRQNLGENDIFLMLGAGDHSLSQKLISSAAQENN